MSAFNFFQGKKDCLKILKITIMCFCQSLSAGIVGALCKIPHMIAEENKSHNFSKALIKQCMSKAAGFLLEKT